MRRLAARPRAQHGSDAGPGAYVHQCAGISQPARQFRVRPLSLSLLGLARWPDPKTNPPFPSVTNFINHRLAYRSGA